jgi:hypothetical protein
MRKLVVLFIFLLAGCQYIPFLHSKKAVEELKPVASTSALVDTSLSKERADRAASEAKIKENEGKVRENIRTAKKQNDTQPAGAATTIVRGELAIADERLSDAPPDAAEQLASAQREALVLSGKVDEAHKAYADAATEAKASSDRVSKAEQAAAASEALTNAALSSQKAALQALKSGLEADTFATQKLLDEQRRDLNNAEASRQAKELRWAAAGCLAIFMLGAGFGQLAGLRIVWPFGLFAMFLFGLAQIVSQPWFLYATGGVMAVGGVAIGWWVWQHYKAGTLAADTKKKAEQLTSFAQAVVPVLDKAYDSAEQPLKQLLDDKIFSPLGNVMDATTKATVHEVRAEQEVVK